MAVILMRNTWLCIESIPVTHANSLTSHPYRLVAVAKIGGRGWRTFDWKSAKITSLSVTVSGLQWQDQDPGCCASKPITVTFRLEHERITERQQK